MPENMQIRVVEIKNTAQAAAELAKLDCDAIGVGIMQGKAVFKAIKIERIRTKAANILKQTFLGKGGDVAVSRHSIGLSEEYTDALIMATQRQYQAALPQLKQQPWGLKLLAGKIEALLQNTAELPKRQYRWKDRELTIDGKKSLVMGILNVTPDSFSDGGKYNSLDAALRHVEKMQADGADIIDIGAESTRPYAGGQKIAAAEEMQRLLPLLEKLLPHCSVPVSIDTYKAETAAAALSLGAHMLNDVWGLQRDGGAMAAVAAEYAVPVIVMHNSECGSYPRGVMQDMHDFFCRSITIGAEKGIKRENIIIDPGIGFAKTTEQNLEIMKGLEQLQAFACPILLAISRKRFIGDVLALPTDDRIEGTIAAALLGQTKGAQIHRVHDVKSVKRALKMMDAMTRSGDYGKNFNS